MTLAFNPLRSMVMTYSQAEVQGQQSVGSEHTVETNEQTDGRRRLHYLPRYGSRYTVTSSDFCTPLGVEDLPPRTSLTAPRIETYHSYEGKIHSGLATGN